MKLEKFKCMGCGAQVTVTDFRGRPFRYLPGSKAVELRFLDDEGKHYSAVAGIMFCKNCDASNLDAEEVKQALIDANFGFNEDTLELKLASGLQAVVVKEF